MTPDSRKGRASGNICAKHFNGDSMAIGQYSSVHIHVVVVRPWEGGIRCMLECHFHTVLKLVCSLLLAYLS